MTLSLRLQKIAEYSGKCAVVADIGTDHALVPVYLIENGLFSHAYACDIGTLPLKRAEKYVKSRTLTDKIDLILSNGLEKVPSDADVVIIAGMGGELIRDILQNDESHKAALFVLQPMTAADELREYLYLNGYSILDEDIVSEHSDTKLYSVMKVRKLGENREFSSLDILISPALQSKNSIEKTRYIEKLISTRKNIIQNLNNAKEINISYVEKLTNEIKELEGCL